MRIKSVGGNKFGIHKRATSKVLLKQFDKKQVSNEATVQLFRHKN